MNAIMFLTGFAIWFLLALLFVGLLVAEGRREREDHPDAAVLPGEFDCQVSGPLDDTEPRFTESADDGARPVLGFMTGCERGDAAGGLAESAHEDHE